MEKKSSIAVILTFLLVGVVPSVGVLSSMSRIDPSVTLPQKHAYVGSPSLNSVEQPLESIVEDYIWAANWGPSNIENNGLSGRSVGTSDPYDGFGIPHWTGNFSLLTTFASVNSITVTALPFTLNSFNYTLIEGVDYLVHADADLIELLSSVDISIINEHWVDGVNNTLNGWPAITYVATGIENVYVDMNNGTPPRLARNLGYAQSPPSEWWFDPDHTWELEGWWALGYLSGPWSWPAGSEWWINYTAASYLTVDYDIESQPVEPEPYITHPLNGSLIGDSVLNISVVEMNLALNIVSTTFEHSTDGLNWTTINVDSYGLDGWGTTWNLSELSEGSYFVKTTMTNNVTQTGEDTSQIYFDPTPPTPGIIADTFPTTARGYSNLTAITFDENVIHTEFSLFSQSWSPCYWIDKSVPNLNQRSIDDASNPGAGLPNWQGGDHSCAPTAAASCLAYWDSYVGSGFSRPYDDLYDETLGDNDGDGFPDGLEEMARDLYRRARTNQRIPQGSQDPETGTSIADMRDALNAYIKSKGLDSKLEAKVYPSGGVRADMSLVMKEFLRCQDVLMSFRSPGADERYGTDDDVDHMVTLSSLHWVYRLCQYEQIDPDIEKWDGELEVMDPATGTKKRGKVYVGTGENLGSATGLNLDWSGDGITWNYEVGFLTSVITVCPKSPIWYPIGSDTNGTDGWSVPWNTTSLFDGLYLVKAIMTDSTNVTGEDLHLFFVNNARVTEFNLTKNVVGQGFPVNIQVAMQNHHIEPVSFNHTFYANESVIYSINITLSSFATSTMNFTWNTESFMLGNYSSSIFTRTLFNETHVLGITYSNGWVVVTIPGDVDGDKDVDIFDIVPVADAYGSEEGQPAYNPNCDIDGDGDVDIFDVVIAAGNYGESW